MVDTVLLLLDVGQLRVGVARNMRVIGQRFRQSFDSAIDFLHLRRALAVSPAVLPIRILFFRLLRFILRPPRSPVFIDDVGLSAVGDADVWMLMELRSIGV